MGRGLIVAAPSSGAGKTTVTLALLRLLAREGLTVRGAKSGPDYIDPRFHEAACGRDCVNLDAWAMTPARLKALAAGEGLLVIEGAMGLFDGAPPDDRGSVADLARMLALPVILVIDAGRMAGSVAALAKGFAAHDPRVRVAGLILNNVGSDRHLAMLRRALAPAGLPVLAEMRRDPALSQPSRHLGLVQAGERPDLDGFLERAADALAGTLDRALAAQAERLGAVIHYRCKLDCGPPPGPRVCRRRHRRSPWPAMPLSAFPIRTCSTTGAGKAPKSASSRRWQTRRSHRPASSSFPAGIQSFMPAI